MEIRLEGLGPLKGYFPPEGHCSLIMERSRALRDILGEKRIPLEAILAVKSDDKVVELDYHPRDGETIHLIPLVGGG